MKSRLRALLATLVAVSWLAPLRAIEGIGDTVVIVQDFPADLRWSEEVGLWNELLAQTREHILKTDQVLQNTGTLVARVEKQLAVTGEPAKAIAGFVGAVPDLLQPVRTALTLETVKHAQESSLNLFAPGSSAVKTYDRRRKVDATYDAFGQSVNRDKTRYAAIATHSAMSARYRTAAANEEEVVKKEIDVQEHALNQLKSALTTSEMVACQTALAASKQRQDAAHQQAVRAKNDLDAFRAELALERDRKAEADQEWADTVVERLRQKALAGYRAQLASSSTVDP